MESGNVHFQQINESEVIVKQLIVMLAVVTSTMVIAAEDANDTYLYRLKCPDGDTPPGYTRSFPGGEIEGGSWYAQQAYYKDKWSFAQCNCTSYVASKLNEAWGNTIPEFKNSYYGQTWGSGYHWFDAARASEIGITGARDRFTFEKSRLNGAFKGDIAVWAAWDVKKDANGNVIRAANPHGHVALVEEDGEPDGSDNGVKCVQVSEYNWDNKLNFGRRTGTKKVCKSTDSSDVKFPHYFIHISQDRTYCLANPTMGLCSRLSGRVATSDTKYYGVFGGAGSDLFNLKVNSFWVTDALGTSLVADTTKVKRGQALTVKVQVKAKNGDTHDHMRPGKNSIEVDIYVREDLGDWRFLQREYIQATNLPSGATHTEHIDYTVPAGITEVSFRAKIDAEDEAYESNEGDNWSEIQTFPVDNLAWLIPIHTLLLQPD